MLQEYQRKIMGIPEHLVMNPSELAAFMVSCAAKDADPTMRLGFNAAERLKDVWDAFVTCGGDQWPAIGTKSNVIKGLPAQYLDPSFKPGAWRRR